MESVSQLSMYIWSPYGVRRESEFGLRLPVSITNEKGIANSPSIDQYCVSIVLIYKYK